MRFINYIYTQLFTDNDMYLTLEYSVTMSQENTTLEGCQLLRIAWQEKPQKMKK